MRVIKPGDKVTHINEKWDPPSVAIRVDTETFPEDPVVFFEEGGFWRSSRLRVVDTGDA